MKHCFGIILALALPCVLAGAAGEGKTTTPTPAPLYELDFEAPNALDGCLSSGGTWATAADETTVLRQTQAAFRGLARWVRQPANYEVSVTARPLAFSGHWGVGVVAYWQPTEGCYRLSNFGNVVVLWRESADGAAALAALRMEFKSQAYRLKLSVESGAQATTLRGKIWALGEREPDEWLITAQDLNRPLRYGRAGVFTGRASALFSEFAVTRPGPTPAADATAVSPSDSPSGNYWHLSGGDWQVTPAGLRQNTAGSTLGFRAAAYGIAAGFTNHTVQVAVKADSGSRNQGFGLSAYWMEDGSQYQFGQTNSSTLFLARRSPGGDPAQLATAPLAIKKGLWYILKLQLSNEKTGVRLRGKAWPARAGEPVQWQVEALDETRPRLLGGEVGLWCLDDVCSFDDLQVTAP